MDVLEMMRGRDTGVEIKRKWKHILFSFLTKLFKNQSLFECVHKQYLQFLCTPAGSCLGDLLQLFDTLTEVWHPLDYSHGDGDCVPTPAAREDSWTDGCIPQVYKVFKQINKFIKVHQIVWVKNLWQGHWWVFAGSWSASSCPRTLVPRRTDPDGPPEASYLPFSLHAQRTWTGGPGIWTKIILIPKQNHKLEAREMCFGETKRKIVNLLKIKLFKVSYTRLPHISGTKIENHPTVKQFLGYKWKKDIVSTSLLASPLFSVITLMFSTVRLRGLTVCGMSCSQLQAVVWRVLIQAGWVSDVDEVRSFFSVS